MIPLIDREAFLIKRLAEHGRHIEDGVTTPEVRRERVRKAIADSGWEERVIGKAKDGSTLRYRDAFELTYGCVL